MLQIEYLIAKFDNQTLITVWLNLDHTLIEFWSNDDLMTPSQFGVQI